MVAIGGGGCQSANGNRIAFVEPQENRAIELRLSDRRFADNDWRREIFGGTTIRITSLSVLASSQFGRIVGSLWQSATRTKRHFTKWKKLQTPSQPLRRSFSRRLSFASSYAKQKSSLKPSLVRNMALAFISCCLFAHFGYCSKRKRSFRAGETLRIVRGDIAVGKSFDQFQLFNQEQVKVNLSKLVFGYSAVSRFLVSGNVVLPLNDSGFESQVAKMTPISSSSFQETVDKLHNGSDTSGQQSRENADGPNQPIKGWVDIHELWWYAVKVAVICGVSVGSFMGLILILASRL